MSAHHRYTFLSLIDYKLNQSFPEELLLKEISNIRGELLQKSTFFYLCRLAREQEYLRMKDLEKLKAEQDYEHHRMIRFQQHKLAEEEMMREKLVREAKYREYEVEV